MLPNPFQVIPGTKLYGNKSLKYFIGVYQQPIAGQPYGQQPQYHQPIQYYPQYQPQYVPQQQFVGQQYPQQFVPQQQYVGPQQPGGQYLQQPLYQPIPVQPQGYLPQQPIYGQFPQNPIGRGKKQGFNQGQLIRGNDPNIANHNLNTIPHDDSEDGEEYEDQNVAPNRGQSRGGRSFQQQPRIFSSSAHNTESSIAFNTTEPSIDSNKFNQSTDSSIG